MKQVPRDEAPVADATGVRIIPEEGRAMQRDFAHQFSFSMASALSIVRCTAPRAVPLFARTIPRSVLHRNS